MERVEIGSATLYRGDCLDVLQSLETIDIAITSPPYNLGATPWKPLGHWRPGVASGSGGAHKWKNGANGGDGVKYGAHDDNLPWAEYTAWQQRVIASTMTRLREDGAFFYNHKPRVVGTKLWTPMELLPPAVELRQIIVWARPGGMNYSPSSFVPTHEWIMVLAKPAFRLRDKSASGLGDVWQMAPERNDHPAPFPVALPTRILQATTGHVVFDPFMGSGTTGVACAARGRRFIGVEIDRGHFDSACERIDAVQRQGEMFAESRV